MTNKLQEIDKALVTITKNRKAIDAKITDLDALCDLKPNPLIKERIDAEFASLGETPNCAHVLMVSVEVRHLWKRLWE